MTRRVMRIPTPSPPLVTPEGLALSDSEKAEAIADSLEAQFQPVNDPSVPAVIEVVNEAMRAYSFAPASEPKLTNPTEALRSRLMVKTLKLNLLASRKRQMRQNSHHLKISFIVLDLCQVFLENYHH